VLRTLLEIELKQWSVAFSSIWRYIFIDGRWWEGQDGGVGGVHGLYLYHFGGGAGQMRPCPFLFPVRKQKHTDSQRCSTVWLLLLRGKVVESASCVPPIV
jgi:hypothetical protein